MINNNEHLNNILLALDLRQEEQSLIAHAGQLAQKFEAKIWVVHIAAPDPDFVGYAVGPSYIRDTRAEELRKEHRILATIADQFKNEGLSAEGLLIQGPTVQMLEEEVVKLSIDLIVLGHHQHSLWHETFVGHTGDQLAKHLSIPILLIPLVHD